MDHIARTNVLKLGPLGVDPRPFTVRGLSLVKVNIADVESGVNEARAIVIAEAPDQIGLVRKHFHDLKSLACNYGLALVVLASTTTHSKLLLNLWKELRLGGEPRIYLAEAIEIVAEFLGRYDPGPPLGDPEIFTSGSHLSPEMRHILCRAFADCGQLYLEPLGGGKASVSVFCVHAWLKKSVVGPRPLPFFIKVDQPKRIERELFNYAEYADFFIPFYLRPNIDPQRCVKVDGLSAIVGNFVDDSRPLRVALRDNQAPGILFSLFEHSLKGFRAQPFDEQTETRAKLATFIQALAKPEKVHDSTISRAKHLGLRLSPGEIEALLIQATNTVELRFNPYHGDLHSGNVMVRGNDAILIDLSAVRSGPLAADPAALEVSLVFGSDDSDSMDELFEWLSFANEIYKEAPVHQPPLAEKRPGPFSWLRRSVREIRHILLGCNCDHPEAAAILATYLMRFARLPLEDCATEDIKEVARWRHAFALVIAERIAKSLPKPKQLQLR